jgi:hypothetical protein
MSSTTTAVTRMAVTAAQPYQLSRFRQKSPAATVKSTRAARPVR